MTFDAITLRVQAGLISFLLGCFRLGFIDVVLSRALLRGFISAVAVVILMFVLFKARSSSINPNPVLYIESN